MCSNTQAKDPTVCFHRFPRDAAVRAIWLEVFKLQESALKPSTRVCSRHFPDGDVKKKPTLTVGELDIDSDWPCLVYCMFTVSLILLYCCRTIGKRFASPIKPGARASRAKVRAFVREYSTTPAPASRSVTPTVTSEEPGTPRSTETESTDQATSAIVHTALLARIEYLESVNAKLRETPKAKQYFRIEDMQDNDKMVSFYTGFVSYMVFNAFFEFLGPVVDNLNYWGSKERTDRQRRSWKLDPRNQLFLVLVKLKQNLKLKDLALRFGLSPVVRLLKA